MAASQPSGEPYPSHGRDARRAQRRMMKDRAKFQRAQFRNQVKMQRRLLRRKSIVGPLIIFAAGIVFLLVQMDEISWSESLRWYGQWWPALLIGVGVILLLEWGIDQRWRPSAGPKPVRVVGGGVVLLLILLTLVGLSLHAVESGLAWNDRTLGLGFGDLDQMFGDRHDGYSSTSAPLSEQGTLAIRNPRGDVSVTGTSTDGQVHVSVHTQVYAWKDYELQDKTGRLQPMIARQGKNLLLSIAAVNGGQADLTVTVPGSAAVTVNAQHGDVNISKLHAPVSLSANHGDVEISEIAASVKAEVNDDNANLTLHGITGPISIGGHSGDIDITDVSGAVELQGDFYGTTYLEHVNGPIRFETSRTRFSAARLDGEFSVENESFDASAVLGPVVLKTSDKNITLERAQGDIEVSDSNGTVELTDAPPAGAIDIQNRHGSVDVGMPAGSGFVLNAQTRNGDMENDFGLTPQNSSEMHSLRGRVGGGGPTVTIATSDGDVTVRRSTVAPLPPAVPATPVPPLAPLPPRVRGVPAARTISWSPVSLIQDEMREDRLRGLRSFRNAR